MKKRKVSLLGKAKAADLIGVVDEVTTKHPCYNFQLKLLAAKGCKTLLDLVNSNLLYSEWRTAILYAIPCSRGTFKHSANNAKIHNVTKRRRLQSADNTSEVHHRIVPSIAEGSFHSIFRNSCQTLLRVLLKNAKESWKLWTHELQFPLKVQILCRGCPGLRYEIKCTYLTSKTINQANVLGYVALWLSTLGGAYSALGEKSYRHAKRAKELAQEQLALAVQLGDEALAARCRLHVALGMAQMGMFDEAEPIICWQAHFALHTHPIDMQLYRMCIFMMKKLQYLRTRPVNIALESQENRADIKKEKR